MFSSVGETRNLILYHFVFSGLQCSKGIILGQVAKVGDDQCGVSDTLSFNDLAPIPDDQN